MAAPAVTSVTDDAKATVKATAKAVAYGLRSTQSRPQTVAEITAKLSSRFDAADVVEAAVAQLKALGAIDDAVFARIWVEDRGVSRGYGRARLAQELRRRQVPQDVAEQALSALDDRDDLEAATELARRRFATLPATVEPAAAARRLHAYLVRRGYNDGLSNKVAIAVSGLDRHRDWD